MNITSNVLSDVRNFLNFDSTSNVFDGEIIPHVMAAIGKLSQNGIGKSQVITDSTTWSDVIESDMIVNPEVFSMVPLYIMLSTKIIFDPPPPSAVDYYQSNLEDLLWRLRLTYDTKEVL